MRARCNYPSQQNWKHYGGRGIKVDPAWEASFDVFRAYVLTTIGDHPGKGWSIDRIDNDGHYEPGNIRWATQQEQVANSRRATKTARSVSSPSLSRTPLADGQSFLVRPDDDQLRAAIDKRAKAVGLSRNQWVLKALRYNLSLPMPKRSE
jgi:hypothetical protein